MQKDRGDKNNNYKEELNFLRKFPRITQNYQPNSKIQVCRSISETQCHSSLKTVYTSQPEKSCSENYKKSCTLEMVAEEVFQVSNGKMILIFSGKRVFA